MSDMLESHDPHRPPPCSLYLSCWSQPRGRKEDLASVLSQWPVWQTVSSHEHPQTRSEVSLGRSTPAAEASPVPQTGVKHQQHWGPASAQHLPFLPGPSWTFSRAWYSCKHHISKTVMLHPSCLASALCPFTLSCLPPLPSRPGNSPSGSWQSCLGLDLSSLGSCHVSPSKQNPESEGENSRPGPAPGWSPQHVS